MKLNWRKIVMIVVCAELLFIYWNSISALPFKKQQTTHPISTPQPVPPLTQLKPVTPGKLSEVDLHIIEQKAS
ncbi:hypothetical protein SAMN04487897_10215 [Paenibacillus sp. yr247]|uniref:hypothetical protein n=1 Tax=Paenibacillus sp. yr247 TaxID=1761880 RepID=UPI0008891B67|nr:hypothetical protein [Paenibacillus sp. yr247]SDN17331.1 hypothetical protein SAMN04487897_10215 [Paenibacillus sp. yr247]